MVSTDDQQRVLHALIKEPITGPLKFKMADIRHVEKPATVMSQ